MTYIVKTMSDGRHGIYDTDKACFPLQGKELREAGLTRINGSDGSGWYKRNAKADAEQIATMLNEFHGHGEYVESKVATIKQKPTKQDDSLQAAGAALIADQAGA